jgi:hypothetical protein
MRARQGNPYPQRHDDGSVGSRSRRGPLFPEAAPMEPPHPFSGVGSSRRPPVPVSVRRRAQSVRHNEMRRAPRLAGRPAGTASRAVDSVEAAAVELGPRLSTVEAGIAARRGDDDRISAGDPGRAGAVFVRRVVHELPARAPSAVSASASGATVGVAKSPPTAKPCCWPRKASAKIPADGPLWIAVALTCQFSPRSSERKTRAPVRRRR